MDTQFYTIIIYLLITFIQIYIGPNTYKKTNFNPGISIQFSPQTTSFNLTQGILDLVQVQHSAS